MKYIITILFTVFAISLSGCRDENIKNDNKAQIELNNGKKWKVDAPMRKYIFAMEDVLNHYSAGQDINIVRDGLKENIEGLTSNCTMEGRAHDELHKWLIPFISDVDKTDSPDDIENLKDELVTFHKYFE